VDQGSHLKLEDALRVVSDTNTAIYSLGFSSSKDEAKREGLANLPHPSGTVDAGPPGGCMAKDPDKAPDPTDTTAKRAFDCASLLLPPLRLAKMAADVALNGLKKNVPETAAELSGGEYFAFKDTKGIERGLGQLANLIPNRYMLSFQPGAPRPGLHVLRVTMKDDPELVVTSRSSYWAEDDAAGPLDRR
jgi:hypothetical protein